VPEANSNGSNKDGKTAKRDKKLTCFICDEEDHFANECPHRKQVGAKQDEEEEKGAHLTWEGNAFMTFKQVNAIGYTGISYTEVLLDNQADISIMKPGLLRAVAPTKKTVKVKGVGGLQLKVDDMGYLDQFFHVYASDETRANVLSFAEVEELYDITYVPREAFIVHLPEQDIEFKRKGKLYVADFAQQNLVYVTQVYTKAEEERAKRAYELVRNSGYPSYQEAIHLVEDGNISHMPDLTAEDVRRAYDLYGNLPEYVRGKMVKKKLSRAVVDDDLVMEEKKQMLYSDVMHVDGVKFSITVCEPLQLTIQCKIERETQGVLGPTLQGQLELLRSRGFIPTMVYTDPQSAFRSLTTQYPGVVIDVGGAGDYVSKVDAKIWRIKELYRSVRSGLPWRLPPSLMKDLVAYAVARLNIWRTTALNRNGCPKVLFTGLCVNYKKELSLAFGDYAEVYDLLTIQLRAIAYRA
jgi:hypothetical protein